MNLYPLIRPFLFLLDAETAHGLAIKALKMGLGPRYKPKAKIKANTRAVDEGGDPILSSTVCDIVFDNPLGLGAGFDKQCEVMSEILAFGFGFLELGTITPLPQPGNPRPRLFRFGPDRALINRCGWNNDGADVCARRIAAWRDRGANDRAGIVGINIGFNKDSPDPIAGYVACLTRIAPYVDFVTISVSTPNSPGVRDLQKRETLTELLARATEARDQHSPKTPIFLKISPDISEALQADIADVVLQSSVKALIVGNTSLTRPGKVPEKLAKEAGGYSGPLMFEPTTKLLGNMYRLTGGKIPLIANCGIFTGADAYKKIRAGASLVQIYTALVYEGPAVVPRILSELAALLKRDGFANVADAVGVDVK
jgi:dihydroorotate dehydrogenase